MRHVLPIAALCLFLTAGSEARAGVYADDLAKCLVRSSSATDKTVLMRWLFGAISTDPALASMTTITPQRRQELDRGFADLVQRLLFADCRKETVDGLKNEGAGILQTSFEVLGRVAAQGLMNSPATAAEFRSLGTYIDKDKVRSLFKEAGLPVDTGSPAKP